MKPRTVPPLSPRRRRRSLMPIPALLALAGGLAMTPVTQAADASARLTLTDINNPVAGQVEFLADGSFTVIAGGNDTWDNEDSFTYVHEERTGDFDVAVRVLSLDVDDPGQQDSAKAALMARSDLTAGSPNVQINALPDESRNTIESIYRPVQDGGTDDLPDQPTSNTRGETPYPDVWLRLKREGNRFTTLFSNDPYSWSVLSSVLVDPAEFPEALQVGVSTVAHVSPSEDPSLRVYAQYEDYRDMPRVPATSVNGEAAGDRAPGAYPNDTVTAVNWKLEVPADGLTADGQEFLYNTGTRNAILVSVAGQGPVPWTAPGYNQGDMDVNLSPRDPVAGLENTGPYGPTYSGDVREADFAPAQGWYPTLEKGMLLGTVRKNGQQWNDGSPAFRGFCWVTTEGSSRRGYSMLDGVHRNQDIYFSIGKLGEYAEYLPDTASPQALREGNIDVAMAWFPFDQGWIGGYFSDATRTTASWYRQGTYGAALGNLTSAKNSADEILKWELREDGLYGGLATLSLPGVNALTDGMIFADSNHEGNDNRGAVVTAAPKVDGTGWVIAIRPDDEDTSPTSYAYDNQSQFGFLYIPYDSARLIGGQIRGATGAKVQSAGDFTVTRLADGQYALEIPGKTGADGMLLLQNSGFLAADTSLADDASLSYEYLNGRFIIESRYVDNSGPFDTTPLRDTDFYFAWVDFATPLTPPGAPDVIQPTFEIEGPVTVTADDWLVREGSVAVCSKRPEALVITIDDANSGGFNDPVTGEFAQGVLLGYFYNTETLQPIGQPFPILGNPIGNFRRNAVAYNPVSDQYVVVTTGRPYGDGGRTLPLIALVNPPGTTPQVARSFAHDLEAPADYDDIGMAVSTANGNILVVAEYQFGDINSGEGEGTVGWMYNAAGDLQGHLWTRLDTIQSFGDEDDPDVIYLPRHNAFFFLTNTDSSEEGALKNRIIGRVIEANIGADGDLILGTVGLLDSQRLPGLPQGHPSSFENPFNGEIVTAFDYGNSQANGDLSFRAVGPAPDYTLTETRPQVPYSEGVDADPFAHRHPRFAADPEHGVIVVSHNRRDSAIGLPNAMVFAILDLDGQPLPSRPVGQYVLAENLNGDPVPTDANYHDIAFDANSHSFLVVFNENNLRTRLARLRITSQHLPPSTSVTLTVSRSETGLDIAWPQSAQGAQLQTAPAVTGPWSPVSTTPQGQGDQWVVPVATTGNGAYFRLQLP